MFKLFKKNKKEVKESYSVVFCVSNDENTAFGVYGTYDTYRMADHVIRMAWGKTRDEKVNDGYRVGEDWIVIRKD